MISQRHSSTHNKNDERRRSRSHSPNPAPPDDDEEDEEEAFLGSSRSQVRARTDLLLLFLRDARIRSSCSFLSSCCCCCFRSSRCSRLRCLQCVLCLVVAVSLLGNFAYRYAEQLAGDHPLRWRVDVHPEFGVQGDDEDAWLRSSSNNNIGKSCVYRRGRWHCQDCGNDSTQKTTCRKLHPRGRCQPFRRDDWDRVPRSVSQYNANHAGEVEFRTLSALGRYHYHSQPQCTLVDLRLVSIWTSASIPTIIILR